MVACGKSKHKTQSVELITAGGKQDSIFQNLTVVTNNAIPTSVLSDSLAFLILPVQAACPSCLNKTIDSIVSHEEDLPHGHFIIISANGGHKTINRYFLEEGKEIPVIENKLFLDSTNQSYKLSLCKDRPTIYYAYNGKVYKKVSAVPATVREDLREFFSGYRNEKQQ
jgi:hypothetical protein